MSVALNIVKRPFATENISGLMTPTGYSSPRLGRRA